MAGIIPRSNPSAQMEYKNPVPIAGTTDAQITGNALESLGKGITDIGRAAVVKYRQQQELERQTRLAEGKNELQNLFTEGQFRQAHDNSLPNGEDMGERFYERATPQMNEVLRKYQNDPQSYKQLSSFAKMLTDDANTTLAVAKTAKLQKSNFDRLDSLISLSADRVRANPSEDMMEAEMRTFGADLDAMKATGALSADQAVKLREMHSERQVMSFISGLHDTESYGKALSFLTANQEDSELFHNLTPDEAKQAGFIDSQEAQGLSESGAHYKVPLLVTSDKTRITPGMASALANLPPDKKAHMLDLTRAKLKAKTEMRIADLNANLAGYERLAQSGQTTPQDRLQAIKMINSNSSLSVDARRRLIDRVNTADVIGEQMQIAANTKMSELPGVIAGMTAKLEAKTQAAANIDSRMGTVDFAVRANREEAKAALEAQLRDMGKQIKEDSASFYMRGDERLQALWRGTADGNPQAVREYMSAMEAKQKAMEVPPEFRRVLPKAVTTGYARALQLSQTSAEANQIVESLEKQYGHHFPQVMQELSRDNKGMEGYAAVLFTDPRTREVVLDAVKNEDTIQAAFKKNPNHTSHQNTINEAIRAQTADFRKAVMGSANDSGSTAALNSFEKVLDLHVKRALNKSGSTDPYKLVRDAYTEIVDSQYQVVSAGQSNVVVPRYIGPRAVDSNKVRAFLSAYSTPSAFTELGVTAPPSYKDKAAQDKYIDYVLPKRHKWVTNTDQSGMALMHVTDDGRLVPVENKYGKPIEMSFEAVSYKTPGRVKQEMDGMAKPAARAVVQGLKAIPGATGLTLFPTRNK